MNKHLSLIGKPEETVTRKSSLRQQEKENLKGTTLEREPILLRLDDTI